MKRSLISITVVLVASSAKAATVTAKPGEVLQVKISSMNPGDELVLPDGTYKGWIDLNHKSHITIRAENIVPVKMQMTNGQPTGSGGRVVVESAGKPFAIANGTGITLKGLTFDGCGNTVQAGAVKCGSGWTLEDCIIQNTDGVGLTIDPHSKNVSWTRVVTQHNGYMGWGGGESSHIRITDCGTFRNNLGWPTNTFGDKGVQKNGKWFVDPQFEAGGGKFSVCDDLIMTRVWAQANNGPGIWFDWQNKNCVVRDSMSIANVGIIHSFDSVGIESEINDGPNTIEHCLIRDNGIGILPAEDHGLSIRNNCLVNNGIAFRNLGNAKDGWRNNGCRDISVVDNSFYGSAKLSFWGERDNMTTAYREAHHIVTSPNTMNAPLPVAWNVDGLTAPEPIANAAVEPTDGGIFVDTMPDILKHAMNGYGQPKLNRSNGEGGTTDGAPLTIAGVTYSRGIGCHAPFRVTIPLDGKYASLRFAFGVDDESRGSGSVAVIIKADDVPLYQSPVQRGGDKAIDVNVNVKGLKTATIQITDADDGIEADHADLVWLRLVP